MKIYKISRQVKGHWIKIPYKFDSQNYSNLQDVTNQPFNEHSILLGVHLGMWHFDIIVFYAYNQIFIEPNFSAALLLFVWKDSTRLGDLLVCRWRQSQKPKRRIS